MKLFSNTKEVYSNKFIRWRFSAYCLISVKTETIQQLISALSLYREFYWLQGTRNSTACRLKRKIYLIQPDAPADRNCDAKAGDFFALIINATHFD